MSVFGGHFSALFSVCDDCILKSTTAWLLKLSVLYIHSFVHVHNNTTFQIKTVLNNVLYSTEVHNPLHAHLLALSLIYNMPQNIPVWPKALSEIFKIVLVPVFIYLGRSVEEEKTSK